MTLDSIIGYRKGKIFFLFLTFFFALYEVDVYSQTVSTLIDENVGDDMHYANDGFIYTSDYGGQAIRKIDPATGAFDIILVPPVSTIGAIEVDDNLEIFVTSYDDGWFGSFYEGDSTITKSFFGIQGPAGIAIDNLGNKYIAANAAQEIIKIDSNNTDFTYSKNAPLFWPTGITTDDQNNVYTSNLFNGNIVKTDSDGNSTLLASLPSVGGFNFILGYLTWHSGYLYVCHVYDHVIYRVDDTTGDFQILAGQDGVAGGKDGTAASATFHNPTGIEVSPDGNTLYVTDGEAPNKRLRTIDLFTLSVDEFSQSNISIYPNPVSEQITINFQSGFENGSRIVIDDMFGKVVKENNISSSGLKQIMNVEDLHSGVYFITIIEQKIKQTTKFIKS